MGFCRAVEVQIAVAVGTGSLEGEDLLRESANWVYRSCCRIGTVLEVSCVSRDIGGAGGTFLHVGTFNRKKTLGKSKCADERSKRMIDRKKDVRTMAASRSSRRR